MPAATEPKLGTSIIARQSGTELAAYPVRHLQPRPGLYSIYRRPVFQVGDWNGDPWTPEQIADLERVHPQIIRFLHPWITVNHARPDAAEALVDDSAGLVTVETPEGLRAFLGFVARLYRNTVPYITDDGAEVPPGHLLLSDWVNVAPGLAQAIDRGNLLRASVGLLEDVEINGTTYPLALEHISCEGEWEAVHTLDDLNRWYFEAPAAGRRRIVTFGQGDIAMKPKNHAADPAAPAAPAGTPEERITNLEKGMSQVLEAVQSLTTKVDAALTADPAMEAEPEEPAAELGAEDEAEEVPVDADGEPEAPAAPAADAEAPAAGDAAASALAPVALQQMERRIEERMRKQFKSQIDAQSKQIKAIDQDRTREFKARRKAERKQFMKDFQDRYAPLTAPLLDEMLEAAEEFEATPAGKVRTFAQVNGKPPLKLSGVIRLFVKNQPPIVRPGTVLEDLDAPPSDEGGQTSWNKRSTAAAIKTFRAKNPKASHSEAVKALKAEHGPAFARGFSIDPLNA